MLFRNKLPNVVSLGKLAFWSTWIALTYLFLMTVEFLPPNVFDWWDKLQHALAFGVLTLLGLVAYGRSAPSTMWMVIAILIYGALIEILQALSGWRYGEFWDWLADLLGVAIGWGIFAYIQKNPYLYRLFKVS
jgi:VanZ family protein